MSNKHVFISYRRVEPDQAFARRLASDLRGAGHSVWMDVMGLESGSQWNREIQEALDECYAYVLVVSPDALASEWVRNELLYALTHKKGSIYPVMLRQAKLPIELVAIQYVDFTGEYGPALARLIRDLPSPPSGHETVRAGAAKPAAAKSQPRPGGLAGVLRRWWWALGGVAALACVVVGWLVISTLLNGGGGTGGVTDQPFDYDADIAEAVQAFDEGQRHLLETGDTSQISQVAAGYALTDRLAALDILTAAGNCLWQYNNRGLTVQQITYQEQFRAQALAEIDRAGRVICDDGERPQYSFDGLTYSWYLVERRSNRWIVSYVCGVGSCDEDLIIEE